jgi:hypothetical protein
MLFLDVEGKEPGGELRLNGASHVKVTARATSPVPVSAIEIVVNGEVAATGKPSQDGKQAEIVEKINIPQSSWIAARVSGEGHRLVVNDPKLFAHTSPVYCYVGGGKITSSKDARLVVAWIDRLLEDVVKSPRFANEQRRAEVVKLFERGRQYFQSQTGG